MAPTLPASGFEIIVGTDRQGSGALHPYFQGDIHEVLVFDRILSGGELNAWGANLQFKYGVEGRMHLLIQLARPTP